MQKHRKVVVASKAILTLTTSPINEKSEDDWLSHPDDSVGYLRWSKVPLQQGDAVFFLGTLKPNLMAGQPTPP